MYGSKKETNGRLHFNKQGVIQTTGHILWVIQFTRNIPEDDEQYFLGITT